MTGAQPVVRSGSPWPFWTGLALQLILAWAAVFGAYELIERYYLQDTGPALLHRLHILRGSGTSFLLALLAARAMYRRREELIVEAKNRLAAEKSRQDEILAGLGAGLIVLDASFKVTYANAQAQKWLGTKLANCLCIVEDCPMGRDTGVCPARVSALQKGWVSFEEKIETPDGTRYLYITASPIGGGNGRPPDAIIELVQDISPIKAMEAKLRQTIMAARVGAIAAGVAHQLGNPLASLTAAVERLLSLGADKQDAYARYLRRIEVDAERAVHIVRSLMDLARRVKDQESRPEDCTHQADLHATVTEAVEIVSETYSEIRSFLKLHLPDHPLPVRANPTDVREVLVNLLENAVEAMVGRDAQRLAIHAAEDRGSVLLQVCDSGPGIEEAARDKIFEPFFSTRREGTGLGLYLCRQIVESYGGEIRADNLPAGGARILVRWPAGRPAGRSPVAGGAHTGAQADHP